MIPAQVDPKPWEIPIRRPRMPLPKRMEAMTKAVVREQRAKDRAAKAQAILPVKLLQTKLGATTYRLWCALLTVRDAECITHPSMPGLARVAGLGEAQTKKSLARLRQFKLIEDFGFMYRRVPCKCDPEVGYHEHKVYVRKVFGELRSRADGTDITAMVPRDTRDLVKDAAGQGGARAGAGRPKGKLDSTPRRIIKGGCRNSKVAAYKYQELISSVFLSEKQRNAEFHSACVSSLQEPEEMTPQKAKSTPSRTTLSRVPSSLQPKEAPMRSSPSQPKAPPAVLTPAAAQPQGDDGDSAGVDLLVEAGLIEVGADGSYSMSGGGLGRQRYTVEDFRAVNRYTREFQSLHQAPPPRVRPEMPEAERIKLLDRAYRAGHERVLRREFWNTRKGKPRSEAETRSMVEAAAALLAEGVCPYAWAKFSFQVWRDTMGKKTAPSPRWVWSAARIHEHAGWCWEAVGSVATGWPMPSTARLELMRRIDQVRSALGFGRPTEVVVSSILPESEYRRLLAQTEREQAAAVRDEQQRILNGEWVWG